MTDLDPGTDLRAVMDRSLGNLNAPDHYGPAAITAGRRMRTRRRIALALTSAAAVAVFAALAVPILGGQDDATPSTPVATDPTPVPSPPPPPDPTPAPGLPAGWWDMPSTKMLRVLEQTLPDGVRVESAVTTFEGVEPGQDNEADGFLWGVLSATAGPGTFQILLRQPDLDASDVPNPVTSTDAEGNEVTTSYASSPPLESNIRCRSFYTTCEEILDASGEQIGKISSVTERGTLLFEATLLGPDGGGLNFTVLNSSGEKPGYEQPSAEVPPLTLEQLRTLAEDPVWTSYRP